MTVNKQKKNTFKSYKLLIVLAVVIIAVGITIGVVIFTKSDTVPSDELYSNQDYTLTNSINFGIETGTIKFIPPNTIPYDELYEGQTKEDVHSIFGTPDYVSTDSTTSQTYDEYDDIAFLGKKGRLVVQYDQDDLVIYANFYYSYSDKEPSEDERNEAEEYALSIIQHYTEICGEPESKHYDYEWNMPDGTWIFMNYDPDDTFLACITVNLSFHPIQTGVLIC